MLVSAVTITALVAGGVLAWRLLRGDEPTATDDSGDWNQLVVVERSTGVTTALSVDGDSLGTVATELATGRVDAVHVEGNRVALVESGQIVLTSLDGTPMKMVETLPGAVVTRLPIDGSLWLAVGSASGGDIVLVDGITGTRLDVAVLADEPNPRYFVETLRHDDAGTSFAVADAGNFQTIVIRLTADGPVTTFFPDQPLAVSADRVVTSQVVGRQADLTLFGPDRATVLATVSGELPAGAILHDGEVTVVSIDGSINRFGKGDDNAERLGAITVPGSGSIRSIAPTADGTRLVAIGDTFETVVDLDGRTVYTVDLGTALDGVAVDPAWRCLPTAGTTGRAIVSLTDGEALADLTGLEITGVAANGCTVIGTRGDVTEVVGERGTASLGSVRAATLAPDGRAAVVLTTRGDTQLIRIDGDEVGDPIDLGDTTPRTAVIAYRWA